VQGEEGEASLIGTVLGGRYRLVEVIGEGGMGRVYRAEQEASGKPVAV
jgi:serine/threonine-protein kinase